MPSVVQSLVVFLSIPFYPDFFLMVLVTSCGCNETMNQKQLGGDRVYFSLHFQVAVRH